MFMGVNLSIGVMVLAIVRRPFRDGAEGIYAVSAMYNNWCLSGRLVIESGSYLATVIIDMPRKVAFPCSVCEKTTKCKKAAIECEQCGMWVHGACIPLSDNDISQYGACDDIYMCRRCVVLVDDGADNGRVCYERLLKK